MQMKNEKTMINLNLSIILLNTWSRKKRFKSNYLRNIYNNSKIKCAYATNYRNTIMEVDSIQL